MKLTTVLLILLALAAMLLGAGYYVFRTACRRVKELPWQDAAALQSTMWAPLASRIHESFDWLEKHNARDVYLDSDDGLKLHGLWIPRVDAVGSILLFHGYRSCPQSDFSMVLDFYHRLGFNLLLADQRSHGKSEGKFITFGIWEHRDVLRWIQWHNASYGNQELFLGGMSMGATTVLLAAGEDLPENVRGITADCGFTTPARIIGREIRKQTHLPPKPLLLLAEPFARLLGKFSLWEDSTVKAMKKCRVPVLMIHGTGDNFVPCDMSKEAYAACRAEKYLILVEGAGHGLSYVVDQPRCQSALEEFFTTHLTNRREK